MWWVRPLLDAPHQSPWPPGSPLMPGSAPHLTVAEHGPGVPPSINVFQRGQHYIFVLTYGSESSG